MKCGCADLRAKTGEWWDCDICYPTPRETFALLPATEVEELKSQLREALEDNSSLRGRIAFAEADNRELKAKVARLERTNTWVSDQRAMKHFKERAEKAESALAQSRQREQEMRGKLERAIVCISESMPYHAADLMGAVLAAIPKEETNGK